MITWDNLGVMYGNISIPGFSVSRTTRDFNYLWNLGFRRIRIAYPNHNNEPDINMEKQIVLLALARGFKTIWGITPGGGLHTVSRWNSFLAKSLEVAAWCEINGSSLLEYSLGNEEDAGYKVNGSPYTGAQIRTDLKAHATAVQAIYTKGKIHYNTTPDMVGAWSSLGLGDIDMIGFQPYHSISTFKTFVESVMAAFPTTGYISEWSDGRTTPFAAGYRVTNNEYQFYNNIRLRLEILKAANVPEAYFFCYNNDGGFGLGAGDYNIQLNDGTFRKAWHVLAGARPSLTAPRHELQIPRRQV